MYMYTRIYFDCVNQESWLNIHVYMLYHKNCFKIARASRAIPGLSRKKLKQKHHFWKVSIAKILNMVSLIVCCRK